jgi:hypothetical protein
MAHEATHGGNTAYYEAQILAHVNSAPIQPGFRGIGTVAGRILDAVRQLVQNGLLAIDDATKIAIKLAALRVYDAINFPQIPDGIENTVKSMFRSTIDNLLDSVLGLPLTS